MFEEFALVAAEVGATSGEELVGDDGEGVLIDAAVVSDAEEEFEGHVGEGADRGAGAGDVLVVAGIGTAGGGGGEIGFGVGVGFGRGVGVELSVAGEVVEGGAEDLDEAEIAEIGVSALVEEDVLRLDVAVDVALLMNGVERAGDGRQPIEALFGRFGAEARAPRGEVSAGEVLEDEVGDSAVFSEVEDADDVGVGESDEGSDFAFEAGSEPGRGEELGVGGLDGDVLVEGSVAREVDDAHSAASDAGSDVVASGGEGLSGPIAGGFGGGTGHGGFRGVV